MRFRREFVVFGVVLVLVVVVAIILLSKKPYDQFNVEPAGTSTSGDSQQGGQGSIGEQYVPSISSDGWIGVPLEQPKPQTDVTDTPQTGDLPGDDVVQPTEPPVSSENPEENQDEVHDELPDDGQGDGAGLPVSDEQSAYMVAYYVCGLEHQLFEICLADEMRNKFGSLSGAPYDTLDGNTSFSELLYDNGVVSFVASDNVTYKFRVSFDGALLSDIQYID